MIRRGGPSVGLWLPFVFGWKFLESGLLSKTDVAATRGWKRK